MNNRKNIRLSLAIAFSLSCVTCGPDEPRKPNPRTTLSGTAYLQGQAAGVGVAVYDFRKGTKGMQLSQGTTTTDENGAWTADLKYYYDHMLVEVQTTPPITAIVPDVKESSRVENVAVNPITTLSTAYATFLAQQREQTVTAAKAKADELVFGHFGGLSYADTMPAAPAVKDSPEASAKEGLLVAGLGELAATMTPSSGLGELLELLSRDILADGAFDGMEAGKPLSLGQAALSGDTLRAYYARAIERFLSSPKNQSRYTVQDFISTVEAIASNTSEIFQGAPRPIDRNSPTISVLTPHTGEDVYGVIQLKAEASDPENDLLGLWLVSPAAVAETNDAPNVFEGTLDTAGNPDGDLVLTFRATDRSGNAFETKVTVMVHNQGALAGYVVKGRVKDATVTAYEWKPGGGSTMLVSGKTDETGRFSLGLGNYHGPLLLVSTSGSYTEEALGTEVNVSRGEFLSALVANYSPAYLGTVTLSPLTTWAEKLAEHLATAKGKERNAAISEATAAISAQFGGLEILKTLPTDLLSGNGCDTLTDRVRYALYCAGLGQMALKISTDAGLKPGVVVTSTTLTDAIADDIGDGVFDGRAGSRPVKVQTYALSSYDVRTNLAWAINEWLGSQQNKCKIGVGDFYEAGESLSGTKGEIFPSSDPVVPYDKFGPAVTLAGPAKGQRIRGKTTIEAHASDKAGIVRFEIKSPAGLIDQDQSNESVKAELDTSGYPDEVPIVVQLEAQDGRGNKTVFESTIIPDNSGPSFRFTVDNEGVVNNPKFAVSGLCKDPSGVEALKIRLLSVPVNDKGEFALDGFELVDGSNDFEIWAQDRLGNETTFKYRVYLDRVKPTLTIHSPSPELYFSDDVVEISAVAFDRYGIKSFTVSAVTNLLEDLDDKADTLRAKLVTANYAEGPVSLQFVARDVGGNVAEQTITIYIKRTGEISGVAFKGPVTGATVNVYDWETGVQGRLLNPAVATTDSSGVYRIQVGAHKGPVLIKVTGGSYKDEAKENYDVVKLGGKDYLISVVNHRVGSLVVGQVASPFSTLAALLAKHRVEEGMPPDAAVQLSVEQVKKIWGFDLNATPLNCREQVSPGFDDSTRAGLLLAGISWLGAHYYGNYNSLSLLQVLYEDIEADGLLDGKGVNGDSLFLGDKHIDANTLRAVLARAVIFFLQDGKLNATGISSNDSNLRVWLDSFALSTDELFDPMLPPQGVDVEPPVISMESHQDQAPVSGTIQGSILVTDNDEVKEVRITKPSGLMTTSHVEVLDSKASRLHYSINTTSFPDGPLALEFSAKDLSGNETKKTLTLLVDNTGPTVNWLSPANNATIVTDKGKIDCVATASDTNGVLSVAVNGAFASLANNFWTVSVPVAEGKNTLTLVVQDKLSNTTTRTRDITIDGDATAPVISAISHAQQQWVSGVFDIVVKAKDNRALQEFVLEEPLNLNVQQEVIDKSETRLTVKGFDSRKFSEGPLAFKFSAADKTGNRVTLSLVLGIDNTPPVIEVISPKDKEQITLTSSCQYNMTGKSTDARSGIKSTTIVGSGFWQPGQKFPISVDSNGFWIFAIPLNAHTENLFYYSVEAVDIAGNKATYQPQFGALITCN